MKKLAFTLLALVFLFPLCAEKATLHTGDAFGFSVADYFFPSDITLTGSKCSITAVKKVEKDVWCLSLAAFRSSQMVIPVVYEYYVRAGDTLKMRRLSNPMEECEVKIESVSWNEVVISLQ